MLVCNSGDGLARDIVVKVFDTNAPSRSRAYRKQGRLLTPPPGYFPGVLDIGTFGGGPPRFRNATPALEGLFAPDLFIDSDRRERRGYQEVKAMSRAQRPCGRVSVSAGSTLGQPWRRRAEAPSERRSFRPNFERNESASRVTFGASAVLVPGPT